MQVQIINNSLESTQCLKNTVGTFVKFPQILIIFGRKMAKWLELCDMHLFSTSPTHLSRVTILVC